MDGAIKILEQRLRKAEEDLARYHRLEDVKTRYERRGLQVTSRELAKSNAKLASANVNLRELRETLEAKARELEQSKLAAEYLARTDALTELPNHRFFFESAREVFEKVRTENLMIMVAMVDIDDFKAVNDNYGHAAGDLAIKSVASILRESVNESNLARLGGEEFEILLPNIEQSAALSQMENLRHSIAESRLFNEGKDLKVTDSFGISQSQNANFNLEAHLRQADQALYMAKREGRNQVRIFDTD